MEVKLVERPAGCTTQEVPFPTGITRLTKLRALVLDVPGEVWADTSSCPLMLFVHLSSQACTADSALLILAQPARLLLRHRIGASAHDSGPPVSVARRGLQV